MPIRNPFSMSKYNDDEMNEIMALQRFYIQDINKELHPYLQMSDEAERVPRYASTKTDLERGAFQTRIGNGALAMEAENLLVNVLQYQRSRYNDFLKNSHLNDPRNLLCEVIKAWVVDTLSHQTINEKMLEDVDRWIKFAHHLTMSAVFPPGIVRIETMEAMLVSFRNSLRYQVRPVILNELRTFSSREQFQLFIHSAKRVLSHGVQFLYFVLRDTKDTPTNCTIPNLQMGCILLSKVLRTSSGRLLQSMVLSAPYIDVFPVGYVPGGRDILTNRISDLRMEELTVVRSEEERSGYAPQIPQIIKQHFPPIEDKKKKKEKEKEKKKIMKMMTMATTEKQQLQLKQQLVLSQSNEQDNRSPIEFFANEISGIARPFRDKKELIESFVMLHGLMMKLAVFVKLLEQAKSLAGEGGDLLIYGVTRKSITSLITHFNVLSNAIRDHVFIIERYADGLYQQIIRENKNAEQQWKTNYLLVSGISMLFHDDLDNCHKAANKIRQQATSYSLILRESALKSSLNIFVNETSSFIENMKGILSANNAIISDFESNEDTLTITSSINNNNNNNNNSNNTNNNNSETTDVNKPSTINNDTKRNNNINNNNSNINNNDDDNNNSNNSKSKETTYDMYKEMIIMEERKPEFKIVSINPPTIPTNGNVIIKISCYGITRATVVHIDGEIIEETFNFVDDKLQTISFISPAFDKPGDRVIRVTNPDGNLVESVLRVDKQSQTT